MNFDISTLPFHFIAVLKLFVWIADVPHFTESFNQQSQCMDLGPLLPSADEA